jgi:hypothetical protein
VKAAQQVLLEPTTAAIAQTALYQAQLTQPECEQASVRLNHAGIIDQMLNQQ